jgi:hypothetical protein
MKKYQEIARAKGRSARKEMKYVAYKGNNFRFVCWGGIANLKLWSRMWGVKWQNIPR